MKNKIPRILITISFIAVLATFFLSFALPKVWDFDVWWHLATGRYIVEKMELPEKDPFSYAVNAEENQKIKNPLGMQFNLQQYWLAQVFFYKIHSSFGDAGIMLLRGLLLMLTVLVIFGSFIRLRVSYLIGFPMIYCVCFNILGYIGERPVLFTILFASVAWFVIDDYRRNSSRIFFFLPLLMLLWANLHGGFIIGIALITVSAAGEILSYLLKRDYMMDRKKLITFCFVGLVSVAASGLNPMGFRGFLALTPQYQALFQTGTQEYYSPFALYKNRTYPVNWWYIFMLALFPVIAVLRRGKMHITHYILLSGLALMSANAARYVAFYVTIGAMIMTAELQALMNDHEDKISTIRARFEPVAIIMILVSAILFSAGYFTPERMVFGKATGSSVPEDAVDFMQKNKIQGNIFNDLGIGGYLEWRFYPEPRVFIDTRALNYTTMNEYGWIINGRESIQNDTLPPGKVPLWERLLTHYKVNVIFICPHDIFGNVTPVIFRLIASDEWVPVYFDRVALIFVRDAAENADVIERFGIAEDDLYNMLIVNISSSAAHVRTNPFYMISLAEIFYNMQNYKDALTAFKYADARLPGQKYIQDRIKAAEEMLKAEEKGNSKEKL
ncbi:MAG: hypothetical protein EPN25_04795 [Nitrospirae bacterium]|nr:MAG: hypothetical protein EPN25_04795 [Nitrospirota bacterium]